MACLDSLQPAAKSIVQAAHSGWLASDQIHQLMAEHAALGVPMMTQQPIRPKAGDLFLADKQRRFDRGDGHDWVDRRSNKLKVDGVEALQAIYFTTRDGTLQRRAYHFLPGCKPELAHLQLLHYHTTEWMQAKFRPKRRRDGEDEPEWQPLLLTAQASPAEQQQQQDGKPAEAAPIYSLRGAGGPTEVATQAARASIIPPAAPPADADPYRWSTTRWNRAERILNECGAIARDLLNNETREVIGKPVDPAKVAEAGVERPMDIGTVLRKLSVASGGYSTPYKFRDDVRLTFSNCRLIYPEGSRECTIAEAASTRFEAEWAAAFVEERWEAHLRLCKEEEEQQQRQQQA